MNGHEPPPDGYPHFPSAEPAQAIPWEDGSSEYATSDDSPLAIHLPPALFRAIPRALDVTVAGHTTHLDEAASARLIERLSQLGGGGRLVNAVQSAGIVRASDEEPLS